MFMANVIQPTPQSVRTDAGRYKTNLNEPNIIVMPLFLCRKTRVEIELCLRIPGVSTTLARRGVATVDVMGHAADQT